MVLDKPWVGLADAIAAVRAELTAAMAAGAGAPVRFTVEPVELDLNVEVRTGGKAEGGVRIGVVSIGASGERSSTSTRRLTVRLQPVDPATGRSPLIADDEYPDHRHGIGDGCGGSGATGPGRGDPHCPGRWADAGGVGSADHRPAGPDRRPCRVPRRAGAVFGGGVDGRGGRDRPDGHVGSGGVAGPLGPSRRHRTRRGTDPHRRSAVGTAAGGPVALGGADRPCRWHRR
ncbi:trypco2 family protein [Candidatus Frankia alpina]|uniref:trypco2 family protein n=1 Tax=Candidatus Frankia alpina TaxID=2699483 RepID=UPI003AF6A9A0